MGKGKRNPILFRDKQSPLVTMAKSQTVSAPCTIDTDYQIYIDQASKILPFYCHQSGNGKSSLIARENGTIYELTVKQGEIYPASGGIHQIDERANLRAHPRGSSAYSIYEKMIRSRTRNN
jgi:hypothetical protein